MVLQTALRHHVQGPPTSTPHHPQQARLEQNPFIQDWQRACAEVKTVPSFSFFFLLSPSVCVFSVFFFFDHPFFL